MSHEYRCNQIKFKKYKKNYAPQPSRIYPRYALVQYLKIKCYNPSHQCIKNKKLHDHINMCRKNFLKKYNTIHDKNFQ